jgi:hypothetical protein
VHAFRIEPWVFAWRRLRAAQGTPFALAVLSAVLGYVGAHLAAPKKPAVVLERRAPAVAPLTPSQQRSVDALGRVPGAKAVGVLQISPQVIADLALMRFEASVGAKGRAGPEGDAYARVSLPLDATRDIMLARTRPPAFTEHGVTWIGEVEETGERALLMLREDGRLSGYFAYKGKVYVVGHVGDAVHTMAEFDPGAMPPDHRPSSNPPAAQPAQEPVVPPLSVAAREALEARPVTIDVMMLYTPAAQRHYIRDPAELLHMLFVQANEAFRTSGLGHITLRLVHSEAMDFSEAGVDQFDVLYRMVDAIGPFARVRRLRDEKRADIVGLVIDDPSGCGLSTRVGAEADEAYFVVHHSCAAITYSIPHEIGHILGARHDRMFDGNELPFPYAHGYARPGKWRDIMSYRESCGGCPRLPFWSNPRVLHKGEPTGTHASDNARVILEQAERVSKFR